MSLTKSAYFTGSNYLSASNYVGSPSTFSVACWIWTPFSSKARIFFSNFSSTGNSWAVGISDSTNNQLKFYLGSNTLLQSGTFANGVWTFCLFTYDGTVARIYLNGNTTANNSLTSTVNYTGSLVNNFIGSLDGSGQDFSGLLAGVGCWSRALTGSEGATLYNSGAGLSSSDLSGSLLTNLVSYHDFSNSSSLGTDGSGNGHTLTNTGTVLQAHGPSATDTSDNSYQTHIKDESGLVAYWKLEESIKSSAFDSKGIYLGIYQSGVTLQQDGLNHSKGVSFPGNVSTGYLNTVETPSFPTGTASRTLECWFKTSASQSAGGGGFIGICGYGTLTNNQLFSLYCKTDNKTILIGDANLNVTFTLTNAFNDGLWHHLVGTYDGTNAALYFDGVQVRLVAESYSTTLTAGIPFYIGRMSGTDGAFNGIIDEVAVYNVALTSTQVLDHYNTGYYFKQSITQTLTLTQSAVGNKRITPAAITQTLTFTQTSPKNVTYHPTSTLTFNQTISNAFIDKSSSSTLALNQALTNTIYHSRTITQSLTFTQTPQANDYFNRSISSTLPLTQNVALVRTLLSNRSSTLTFNQSLSSSLPGGLSQSINQTLAFNDTFLKAIPINNLTLYVPIVAFSKQTLICQVTLYAPSQIVALPCPLFGDRQALTSVVAVRKTMTNNVYTYIKSSELQRLNYSFSLTKTKANELLIFLNKYYSDRFTMNNWKGEQWVVYITNDPIDMITQGLWNPNEENVRVELDFEGVKVN